MPKMEISGNTQSLKASILDELSALYDILPDSHSFLPEQLLRSIAAISGSINREIAVYLNRKGTVLDICIGDSSTVTLSQVEGRRSRTRLSGVRCIHTHPNGDSMLSAVDIHTLLVLNLDAMASIGVLDGKITGISAALPVSDRTSDSPVMPDKAPGQPDTETDDFRLNAEILGPFGHCSEMDFLLELIRERDREFSRNGELRTEQEKAVLVGLELGRGRQQAGMGEAERSLAELGELALTAGLLVCQTVLQRRPTQDPAFYIGRGKVEEISLIIQSLGAETLVFDDELSGAQIRNIEGLTGAKVLDRTMLILDIFAQRARSREGKLQVELAQLKYRLPRLTGLGGQLSRLGGGIGTRGPGEKKLEVDRRHIRRRVSALEQELDAIEKRRKLSRESRRKNAVPVAALVGYTNSGKSTLLNRLCKSDVLAENKLFATLDPTIRRLVLPDGREILLVDTVGFIRKLPHELIEAFKSTLEEAVSADLLLHVVDASDEEAGDQVNVTGTLLQNLGAGGKPTLMVLNKQDKITGNERRDELQYGANTIEVSAQEGTGIEELLSAISAALGSDETEMRVRVPYTDGWVLPYLHENGCILNQEYLEAGVEVFVRLKKSKAERIREYVIT